MRRCRGGGSRWSEEGWECRRVGVLLWVTGHHSGRCRLVGSLGFRWVKSEIVSVRGYSRAHFTLRIGRDEAAKRESHTDWESCFATHKRPRWFDSSPALPLSASFVIHRPLEAIRHFKGLFGCSFRPPENTCGRGGLDRPARGIAPLVSTPRRGFRL